MAAKRTREDKDQKEKVILRLLEEGHSTEEIAQRLGYKDRDSVGKYMRRRGYEWTEEEKTYHLPGEGEEGNKDHTDNIDTDNIAANHKAPGDTKNKESPGVDEKGLTKEEIAKFIQYLPTLEKIHKEKETLDILLKENGNIEEKRLPRYLIGGEETLKSLSLPDSLCGLLDDYSQKFKVSKKEILKIALVEFFRKYGRKKEIDEILGG